MSATLAISPAELKAIEADVAQQEVRLAAFQNGPCAPTPPNASTPPCPQRPHAPMPPWPHAQVLIAGFQKENERLSAELKAARVAQRADAGKGEEEARRLARRVEELERTATERLPDSVRVNAPTRRVNARARRVNAPACAVKTPRAP